LLPLSPEKNNSPKLIEKSSSAISDEIKAEINEDINKTSEKRISIQNIHKKKMIIINKSLNSFENFKKL